MNQPRMDSSLLLMEDIVIPNVDILGLSLETNEHAFERSVLRLLTKCHGITELGLSFQIRDEVIIPSVVYWYSAFSASYGYNLLND